MKIIPSFRVLDMKAAVDFYTIILDFKLKYPTQFSDDNWVVDLINGEEELWLTKENQTTGNNIYIRVDDVDALFEKYKSRGLVIPARPESPVHTSPINQTWGMREFYIDDPSGNTLRFGAEIKPAS